MKPFLFILLALAARPLLAQETDLFTNSSAFTALVTKVRNAQASPAEKQQLAAVAGKFQNESQQGRQNKKALEYIDKSILAWQALADTPNLALNHKYKAFLLGRMGKYTEAKQETNTTIALYTAQKENAGVALAQLDLARFYQLESKLDSAVMLALTSRAYWKRQGNQLRVLMTNNMLVNLELEANEPEKGEKIFHESQLLAANPEIHWQALLDFYYTSFMLYQKMNDVGTASRYRSLYFEKQSALSQQGISARSYYEEGGR
ncbi:MAG: hypothetical protein KGO82_09185 [Bacteroidota bacterium]|nr:hypothetical protein [Bacteroidota bacterium]